MKNFSISQLVLTFLVIYIYYTYEECIIHYAQVGSNKDICFVNVVYYIPYSLIRSHGFSTCDVYTLAIICEWFKGPKVC